MGQHDPGNVQHYARMSQYKASLEETLLPSGVRLSYVGSLNGSLSVIWYFGKAETGFANGGTPAAVVADIYDKVFGGL